DEIFPVCAPGLAARLCNPDDLAEVPCLSDAVWSGDWQAWADAVRPGWAFVPRGPVYSLFALAVEETVNGAGVLMGHAPLVAQHLASGALVAPFGHRHRLRRTMRLWSARPLRPGSAAARVADWLSA
ncbi:MAG: LysR family transcriptional regulator, partial [Rhodobacteraceae bacterium]|nr:LysR family transcriptional regulator [Paracoccaceae bacterium]